MTKRRWETENRNFSDCKDRYSMGHHHEPNSILIVWLLTLLAMVIAPLGRQRPLRKDLSEGLLGVFHDDEQSRVTSELTTAGVEKPNQTRMGEAGRYSPVRELYVWLYPIGADDLDRGTGQVVCFTFGEEYRAVV